MNRGYEDAKGYDAGFWNGPRRKIHPPKQYPGGNQILVGHEWGEDPATVGVWGDKYWWCGVDDVFQLGIKAAAEWEKTQGWVEKGDVHPKRNVSYLERSVEKN